MSDVIQFPRGIISAGNSGLVARLDAVIKFPRPGRDRDLEIERIIYERLTNDHNGILKYFGAIGDGLVLQCALNGALTVYLSKDPPLSLRLRWIRQVAEAVAFIHSRSVLHCDIHCNIFIDANLDAKLGDFSGSAIDNLKPLIWYATSHHHPDETELSVRTEIFALGSAFYHILKGAPTYEGMNAELSYSENEYPKVISMGEMGDIIMACWQMEFDNVDDLVATLATQSPQSY
jgi:serine/threonine protein kinase